jgi:hypothetical protein
VGDIQERVAAAQGDIEQAFAAAKIPVQPVAQMVGFGLGMPKNALSFNED